MVFALGPGDMTFGRMLPGDNNMIASLMRKNSLFLSAAAQNNHKALLPVYEWFRRSVHFVLVRRRRPIFTERMRLERSEIARLMTLADLGIEEVRVGDQFRQQPPFEGLAGALDFPAPSPEFEFLHQFGESLVPFKTKDESDGTMAYFSLLGPILRALRDGSVLAIDEIDSSLHPSLLAFLVRLFCNKSSNPKGAQLIFNTHDTNLLVNGVLQRDQIWFTEKDREGVSHLFPLSDFKPRPDENFQKRYLQGRFGAIPFIDSERILEGLNAEAQPR